MPSAPFAEYARVVSNLLFVLAGVDVASNS
jgi:hypothetical protein